jgi:hypothetical protein
MRRALLLSAMGLAVSAAGRAAVDTEALKTTLQRRMGEGMGASR